MLNIIRTNIRCDGILEVSIQSNFINSSDLINEHLNVNQSKQFVAIFNLDSGTRKFSAQYQYYQESLLICFYQLFNKLLIILIKSLFDIGFRIKVYTGENL